MDNPVEEESNRLDEIFTNALKDSKYTIKPDNHPKKLPPNASAKSKLKKKLAHKHTKHKNNELKNIINNLNYKIKKETKNSRLQNRTKLAQN